MQRILITLCFILTLCFGLNVWADDAPMAATLQDTTATTPVSAPTSDTTPATTPSAAPTTAAAAGAAAAPAPKPIPVTKLKNMARPCKDIQEACESAGFTSGGALHKNCLGPLMKGQTVKGVNIDPDLLKACMSRPN
jgi:hypothetical protein